MRKIYLLFITIIVSFLMMSCSGHFFNPRYYFNKNGSQESEQTPPPDIDIGGGEEGEIPEGPWNNEDYIFDGSIIKDYAFGAS